MIKKNKLRTHRSKERHKPKPNKSNENHNKIIIIKLLKKGDKEKISKSSQRKIETLHTK